MPITMALVGHVGKPYTKATRDSFIARRTRNGSCLSVRDINHPRTQVPVVFIIVNLPQSDSSDPFIRPYPEYSTQLRSPEHTHPTHPSKSVPTAAQGQKSRCQRSHTTIPVAIYGTNIPIVVMSRTSATIDHVLAASMDQCRNQIVQHGARVSVPVPKSPAGISIQHTYTGVRSDIRSVVG